jgi:hypothetical protein
MFSLSLIQFGVAGDPIKYKTLSSSCFHSHTPLKLLKMHCMCTLPAAMSLRIYIMQKARSHSMLARSSMEDAALLPPATQPSSAVICQATLCSSLNSINSYIDLQDVLVILITTGLLCFPLSRFVQQANHMQAVPLMPGDVVQSIQGAGTKLSTGLFGGWAVLQDDPTKQVQLRGHDDEVTAFAMCPNGSMLATGQKGKNSDVVIWDTQQLSQKFRFQEHDIEVCALGFSADNKLLASVGNER